MASSGAESFPPGYLAEYSGGELVRVAAAFIVLEILFVGARFYAKTKIVAPLGPDDYVLLPALFCALGCCIIAVHSGGVGYHVAAVAMKNPNAIVIWAKGIFAMQILYAVAISTAKLSILFFYLRIFPTKWFRISVFVLIFMDIGLGVSIVALAIFQCHPTAYLWNKAIHGGWCINQLACYRWISLPNIIIDVAMLVLPLPLVWRLQTSSENRVGLTVLFVVGSIGIVSAALRMNFFFRKDVFLDPTWTAVPLQEWSLVEPGVYVIAACLPTLRPLLVQLTPRIWARVVSTKASKDVSRSTPVLDRNDKFRRLDRIPLEDWNTSASKLTAKVSEVRDAPWEDVEANVSQPKSTLSSGYYKNPF
ncbi:MAG: hypothetical protein ASARMPREDX12_001032 [Alectoria sarmentosa]|nr:MAG: hypothetical protein ASARMPREDX12_001032 [Alectoria sarmentosa]